jgi:uncharacterized small protein (DUF1192 family)
MIDESEDAKPKPKRLERPLLEPLGVTELRSYIAELQAEIHRVEAAIAAKEGHRNAADAFFRKT